MNRRALKLKLLAASKACGLFELARRRTRSRLRILCYHGFATGEESAWAGGIMLRPETLRQRLKLVRRLGGTVLELGEAVDRLARGDLPPLAVVVTVDDGFRTTLSLAHPLFREFACPYTVYLTTYYCGKDLPIVNLLLRFALWKTTRTRADLSCLGLGGSFDLGVPADRELLFQRAFVAIDAGRDVEEKRAGLARFLGGLGLDAAELLARDTLKILDADQVRCLRADGVDIQLHTHRHRFPVGDEALRDELERNRAAILSLTGATAAHLCYPSGQHRLDALPLLAECGVASATLAEEGLNDASTHPLLLKRFLDAETVDPLECEAYLCGFTSLAKDGLAVFGGPAQDRSNRRK